MPTKIIRVGLVGAGSIAQLAELPALSAELGVIIAGVVTRHSTENVLKRWPIEKGYETTEEMIHKANLDALFVLTPKQTHNPFVELGLKSGLDVFCEKPLSTSLEESKYLTALADKVGKILMVGFNRRYAEVYVKAHEQFKEHPVRFCVAQKNKVGTAYRATLENAIHMIDLMRWFCGEPKEVTAYSTFSDPYQEDGTMALIQFDSGAIGTLVAARCAGEWDERFDAYGNMTSVRVVAPDSVAVSCKGETRSFEMRPRASGWAQVNKTFGFGPEVAHFIQCVHDRRQPLTNGHEATLTQALAEEILKKAGLPLVDSK
jgi:virulence factor